LLVLSVFMFMQHQDLERATAGLPSTPAGKIWQQVWSDEFNGSSVDTSKWNIQNNANYGSGNNEDQCYMANNVSVAGGALRLTGKRETVNCGGTNPNTGNSTYYFTSGMVTGRAQGGTLKYKFNKGYIEARMKAPKGNPYWPAFWLVSPNDGSTPGWPDYGEFDITELYGVRPDVSNGAFHYKCTKAGNHCQTNPTHYNIKADSAYGGNSNLGTQILTQAAMDAYTGGTSDYNTYGFLWEADKITWYVNGRKTRYFDGTSVYRIEQNGSQTLENTTATLGQPAIPFSTVFNYDHSINLNLALGGDGPRYSTYGYTGQDTAGGYSDGNLVMQNPGTLEIDYVRVYQLANEPAPTPTPVPVTPTPTPVTTPVTPAPAPTSGNATGGDVVAPTTVAVPAPIIINAATGEKVSAVTDNTVVAGSAVLSTELATSKAVQAKVDKVEYYINGSLKQTLTSPPYQFNTKKVPDGKYTVKEKVYFKDGTVSEKTAAITIQNVSAKKQERSIPWTGVAAAGVVVALVSMAITLLPPFRHIPERIFRRIVG
jgi:beta-glucanase (GH16 family)